MGKFYCAPQLFLLAARGRVARMMAGVIATYEPKSGEKKSEKFESVEKEQDDGRRRRKRRKEYTRIVTPRAVCFCFFLVSS